MPPERGHIHLVIPAYREAERLPGFLRELASRIVELSPISILVVEDSGTGQHQEATLDAIRPFIKKSQGVISTLTCPKNLGKGGAIKAGWDKAPDDTVWLAFVDADGSIPPREAARMASEIRSRCDTKTAYFASRVLMLGRNITRNLHRHLIGRVFATFSSHILGIRCYDSQCGLKFVPAHAYHEIRSFLKIDGFAFDAELLAFLTVVDTRVEEFPVDWHDAGNSSVNLLRDPFTMFLALLDIKRRQRTCDISA